MTEIGNDIGDLIGDFLSEGEHRISLTFEEAVCVDYVITSPTWDGDLLGRLDSDKWWRVREQVGKVIGNGQEGDVVLHETNIRDLLIIVPTLFAVGPYEVGTSVKAKLYRALLNLLPDEELVDKEKDGVQIDSVSIDEMLPPTGEER